MSPRRHETSKLQATGKGPQSWVYADSNDSWCKGLSCHATCSFFLLMNRDTARVTPRIALVATEPAVAVVVTSAAAAVLVCGALPKLLLVLLLVTVAAAEADVAPPPAAVAAAAAAAAADCNEAEMLAPALEKGDSSTALPISPAVEGEEEEEDVVSPSSTIDS